ncbi:MAG TPA: DUF3054 domain-containing protein [Anaerolineales bacterium]|nr:DUF3054 domain-containing protein [Anaerolineales bacterium]
MKIRILILGDILAIALLTIIGFATHGETDLSYLPRMAVLFFPLLLAWFALAPSMRLFDGQITSDPKQLWRPILAMTFAASLAAILRGLLLNAAILPIFGLVLAVTSAFGMLVWRAIYLFLYRKGSEIR